MSGALTERVFVEKMTQEGFTAARVVDRRPFGLDDAARYPLFTPDLIELMRQVIPPERQAEVACSVTVTATKE